MHINVLLQLIAASGLAVMPTFAAPALEPAALAKRTTYSGFCVVSENACHWYAQDGQPQKNGVCTCSTGNECRINTGACFYNDETLSCICPNGQKE